ncbi:hypothetical protein GCM10007977_043590 [Dactylosporangium sucinum]|uniref:Uncharacterized protein n=1 Tax=Dactylosporangium sucinum TaxID=1424081 RepID=A0A917TV92_9ACTN|nr:hypothetical protein GCM10007977_043590 [Dactylosporangium sucinum]
MLELPSLPVRLSDAEPHRPRVLRDVPRWHIRRKETAGSLAADEARMCKVCSGAGRNHGVGRPVLRWD